MNTLMLATLGLPEVVVILLVLLLLAVVAGGIVALALTIVTLLKGRR